MGWDSAWCRGSRCSTAHHIAGIAREAGAALSATGVEVILGRVKEKDIFAKFVSLLL
jgi:hypothetical protein